MVSTDASHNSLPNCAKSSKASNSPRFAKAPPHANIVAIGFVDVFSPFK